MHCNLITRSQFNESIPAYKTMFIHSRMISSRLGWSFKTSTHNNKNSLKLCTKQYCCEIITKFNTSFQIMYNDIAFFCYTLIYKAHK